MIPVLPATQVRAAIDAGEWTAAGRLLDEHQRVLIEALACTDLASEPAAPWRELLLAQRALLDELQVARDQAAHALDKLGDDRRGARAWMRALA
jgi:hypothetical protein